MFRHVVCFRFKPEHKDKLSKAKEDLLSLKQKVESIRQIQVGLDELHTEKSYDIGLIVDFDDKDGYQAYAVHPEHRTVGATLEEYSESRVSVDYNILDRITI